MSKRLKKIKDLEELMAEIQLVKEDIPYKIPSNWIWVTLNSISKVISKGTTPPKSKGHDYSESGINFIRVENINKQFDLDLSNVKYITSNTHTTVLKRSIGEEGDVLISIAGALGRVAVLKKSHLPCNMNQAVAFVRLRKELIDPNYVKYAIASPIIQNILIKKQKTTAQPNLTLRHIGEIPIPLPPKNEQKQIVEKVERLLNKLVNAKQIAEEVKESYPLRRAAILDKAIKGELVNQDFSEEPVSRLLHEFELKRKALVKEKKLKRQNIEPIYPDQIPYSVPKNWGWVRLEQIIDLSDGAIRRGPFGSAITKEMFVPKGKNTYKIYEQKNAIQQDASLGEYYINEEKFQSLISFKVEPGDIIVSCAGTIGKTYIIPDDAEAGIINQALLKIRLNNDLVDNQYFLYLFEALLLKDILLTAKGSAMKNMVSIDYLKKVLLIPLPPLKEQKKIVEKLNIILEKHKKEEENVELFTNELDILKQSILNKALRGDLVLNVLTGDRNSDILREL